MKRALLLPALAALLFAADASAITREEALTRARAYAAHRWSSTSSNQTASCSASYKSLFPSGDYVGIPYGWGGYMTLLEFDQGIKAGKGAGAQESDGILGCIVGVDCSGFVSKVWNAGHYTTSNLAEISSQIAKADLLPGDVFNKAGFHVAMYTHTLQSGEPALIEAVGYNTHPNTTGGWSWVNGYLPRRYNKIEKTTAGNPAGTTSNPIAIPSFPYTDSRDTRQSSSSVLDGCAAEPSKSERGPEYVYVATMTSPGTLTVSVQDDAATDVDVELLTNLNTAACVGRHDSSLVAQVGCGTYWIVADTFGADASKAGPYTLTATFTPSGQPCSAVSGPPKFDPKGKMGDECAYPGNENLPFCNPNLGSETCIYGSSTSFCSKPCASDGECSEFSGGCCRDLGKGEKYCMTQPFCSGSGGPLDAGVSGGPGPGGGGGGDPDTAPGDEDDDEAEGEEAAPAGGSSLRTVTTGGCGMGGSTRAPWAALLGAAALSALSARARRRR